jgi:hypothetical protein
MEFRRARSFMTGQELWFADVPDREVEIAGGGLEAPDPGRVAQAAWAVERLDALLERAGTYLDHFVDRERLGGGEWRLDSIELGRCDCDPRRRGRPGAGAPGGRGRMDGPLPDRPAGPQRFLRRGAPPQVHLSPAPSVAGGIEPAPASA